MLGRAKKQREVDKMSKYTENSLYLGVNGKVHCLIQRAEDLKAEIDRQIEEDNYLEEFKNDTI